MNPAVAARWQELAPLLDRLLDRAPEEREALLAAVADEELRALLRDLLARESQQGFLDGNSADYAESLIGGETAALPAQIGPYRVIDLIGEGGSGSVYRAEREVDGYVQRVALKLLRVGLRDPHEQARFRRERRILARLEHPSIARLIDGGFTPDGVPWFALDYVEGVDIVRWCDAQRLRVDQRVDLFLDVCDAVEAAHRALIVHRDIKPANILVDAQGRPRLLDFGIAKLLDDSERDDDTRTGLRRLTPAYAAPEQFSGGGITTATDVYALGVLLHELLTGRRPGLRGADAPRRLSQLVDSDSAAPARATTPRQLAQQLRGDLDLIVATALAPDPAQRYAGVAALAADLRAHREGRAIAARRASTGHRLKKFLLRHRVGVAATVLIAATALAGVVTTWRESRRANVAAADARAQAQRAEAVKDFVLALFAGVSPDESKGRTVSARELIARGEARLGETLATHPELRAELTTALAGAYRQLGTLDRAATLADDAVAAGAQGTTAAAARIERARVRLAQAHFDAARDDLDAALATPDVNAALLTEAQRRLAEVFVEQGQPALAQQALQTALARTQRDAGSDARRRDLAMLGPVQFRAGDIAGAEASLREALALSLAAHGAAHTETARIRHDLGVILLQRGATAEAAEVLAAAEATRRQLLGGNHPDYAQSVFNLAVAKQRLGDAAAAAALYEQAIAIQRAGLGPDHPDLANSLNSLAVLAWSQGQSDLAIARMSEALATARRGQGDAHPSVATMLGSLSGFERFSGRLDEALAHSTEGLAIARRALGERHYLVGVAGVGVAATQFERGDATAALVSYRDALAVLDATLGATHADTLQSRAARADALLADGDAAAAAGEIDAVLANLGDSLPPGHPRRARLELVKQRIEIARGNCAVVRRGLDATAAALAKGGLALLPDLASAQALQARCTEPAEAAALAASARASAERLPYVPRRLRAELAALPR
ncbi:MAG TPA: serine/threonine-protein kinase [Tahibacter sp.]|uniref:serine/threonine-protein kinase n=1 Tax=Tahibacter sp. TaxID=2056211 RepID=UPI002C613E04|nr:serine/threonine-protein kinase [Tahibacter sp.]HSX59912.1 serine/threonine-protein kinase [Tahibacter sp.]